MTAPPSPPGHGPSRAKRAGGATAETLKTTEPAGYHHGHLREALVEAGLQVLEEMDRADLSLREVARRVGVSANAVYHHFANKEALLAALAAEGFRRLGQAQLNPPPEVSGVGQAVAQAGGPVLAPSVSKPGATAMSTARSPLHQAGLAYVRFAMAHPALFRLMYGGFTAGQNHPELVNASMDSLEASMQAANRHLPGGGDANPASPQDMLLLWSIVHGLSNLALGGQLGYFGSEPGEIADAVLARAQALLAKG